MGIDYDRGLERFLDDAELYETALLMFIDSTNIDEADRAFERQDYASLFEIVHSLKGVCGNLDISDCYQAACKLTDLLRDKNYREDAIARDYGAFHAEYLRAYAGIKAAL